MIYNTTNRVEYVYILEVLKIKNTEIFDIFYDVIKNEVHNTNGRIKIPNASYDEILGLTNQIREVAKSSTVPRSCSTRYSPKTIEKIAPESVGSHTNLMATIIDRVLAHRYGSYFSQTEDNFTYREIMEVARRHDLPENVIGDIPDNGNRHNSELAITERAYHKEFIKNSPSKELKFEERIKKLQDSMNLKNSFSGRLLYAADKVSAIIHVLELDSMSYSPVLSTTDKNLSSAELEAMKICDYRYEHHGLAGPSTDFKASELWTIDYFKTRKLYDYDDTGLITAILIMDTILINGKWYDWRRKDYEDN